MKNITLSVDEEVLEKVRIIAAEEKTSVNKMVQNYLQKRVEESALAEERKAAAARLLELSRTSQGDLGPNWKFDREEIYAERILGHKRNTLRGGGEKK